MKLDLNHLRMQKQLLATLGFCSLAFVLALGLAGCATNQDSSAPVGSTTQSAAAKPASHSEVVVLREGDVVNISVPESPDLNATLPIRRDGKLSLQLVGEVQASGLTPDQLQDQLIKLYTPQIGVKHISVALQSSSFPVFVTGAVVRPGKVLSDHPLTALEAVMEAGGFDYTTANTRAVKIIRNQDGVMKHYVVNLQRILDGKGGAPFYLQPDDIIYVSERFELF